MIIFTWKSSSKAIEEGLQLFDYVTLMIIQININFQKNYLNSYVSLINIQKETYDGIF